LGAVPVDKKENRAEGDSHLVGPEKGKGTHLATCKFSQKKGEGKKNKRAGPKKRQTRMRLVSIVKILA